MAAIENSISATQPTATAPVLRLEKVSKHFGGVRALQDVSLELLSGEVHALVGENGAGKSTLIKIITGAVTPDRGTLAIDGRPVERNDPGISRALGIAAIYQQPALFGDLTVAENIALRLEGGGLWRVLRWRERARRASELLARVGANISSAARVRELTMPQQQLVEIAAAIGAKARILILDEPTASLGQRETENLFSVIRELKSQGVGMIYISHRLAELPAIADRVTVLRDGRGQGTRAMSGVDSAELIRLMVGRELSSVFPKIEITPGEMMLEMRNVGYAASGVSGVNLSVRAGEIVGLAGLVGAGRTELARILFGLTPADSGEIFLQGKPVRIDSPAAAVKLGLAYVPEDRRRHGVILEMPIAANTTLAVLKQVSTFGLISSTAERALAAEYATKLGTKAASLDANVGTLSGGNQQKVAVSRWLAAKPSVIILDEPTQGVDVGAKAEIHRLMGELAKAGLAIIMISSELPEVLGISDRVAVMCGGRIVSVLGRGEATAERVISLALGTGAAA